ncbi:MAG: hypothetical protein IJT94_09205 [Oscillibacter sp.]|nr:hypothetical protein [Oscillibacter sp.]
MYNRYIRNDHGTYTRIPEEDGPPVPPSGGEPLHRNPPDGVPFERGENHREPPYEAYHSPPSNGGPPDGGPHGGGIHSPPPCENPPRRANPGGVLRRLLDDARMDRIDNGDLMLLVLLFFLAREGADEELLTALGLLLIL